MRVTEAEPMPEIVRLSRCKICVYPGDHAPPHFHIRGPEARASIHMVTLEILKGKAARKALDEAREWAAVPENLAVLVAAWRRLNDSD